MTTPTTLPHLVIFTADSMDALTAAPRRVLGSQSKVIPPSAVLPSVLPARTFGFHVLTTAEDVLTLLLSVSPAVLVVEHEGGEDGARKQVKEVIGRLRALGAPIGKRAFVVLWSSRASVDARERSYWSRKGVNMVTDYFPALYSILTSIHAQRATRSIFDTKSSSSPTRGGRPGSRISKHTPGVDGDAEYSCPYCGLEFTISKLRVHVPLYHTQEPGGTVCSVCKESVAGLPKHLDKAHGDGTEGGSAGVLRRKPVNHRQPVFALVVCRRPSDGRFLMVDEVSSQGWWLPGGGVEVGEDLVSAAERETLEEAGVVVLIKGILRMEYTPSEYGFRIRVIFYAEPAPESNPSPTRSAEALFQAVPQLPAFMITIPSPPKHVPDVHSAGACWVALEHFGEHLPLRGREPLIWFPYVAKGGAIWPLNVLGMERDDVVFVPGTGAPGAGFGVGFSVYAEGANRNNRDKRSSGMSQRQIKGGRNGGKERNEENEEEDDRGVEDEEEDEERDYRYAAIDGNGDDGDND
ncbi:hypothetical protein BJ742DRAFT_912780 [Cladochytrium replicatum]|nr:hypothetical protein BJ742DRAFT_912780 [Cladochytrium replicatum]